MAKMFYTLEEAAQRLNKTTDAVRKMAESGQLQEFRDRDKLVFKREQVEMLAGDGPEVDSIPLADTSVGLSLDEPAAGGSGVGLSGSGTGSGIALENPGDKDKSGISIFEEDDTTIDASAQTQITSSAGLGAMDAGASGSNLLGVTRDPDDSHLGSDLLKDLGGMDQPSRDDGPLFESTGVTSDVGGALGMAPMGMMMAAEVIDGPSSGLTGGLAGGMVLVGLLTLVVVLLGIGGPGGAGIIAALAGNYLIVVLVSAVLVAALGGLGWFLGKKG